MDVGRLHIRTQNMVTIANCTSKRLIRAVRLLKTGFGTARRAGLQFPVGVSRVGASVINELEISQSMNFDAIYYHHKPAR